MAEPVKALASADLSGNGKQFLVTLETSYEAPVSAPARNLKVWEWNGFGFSSVTKIDGNFNQLVIARVENEPALIIVP